MRQHAAAAAADLPKPPHLAKETAAAVANGCAAARRAEAAPAAAGHLMQESAMGSDCLSGSRARLPPWRRRVGRGWPAGYGAGRGFIGGIEEGTSGLRKRGGRGS